MSAHANRDASLNESDGDGSDRGISALQSGLLAKLGGALFHESVDTLILGTISTSLGIALILITLRGALGPAFRINMPETTYFALVPIGTSIGVIGIVRARILKRFTSPLSTLGAVLCFIPAAPHVMSSVGIYLLILAPFAIGFYGSAIAEKLLHALARKRHFDDESVDSEWDRDC